MIRLLTLCLLLTGCADLRTSYKIDRAVWHGDQGDRSKCVYYSDEAVRILGPEAERYVVSGPYPDGPSDNWHVITCLDTKCYNNLHAGSTKLESWDILMTYDEYLDRN